MTHEDERFLAKRVALVTGSLGRGIGRSVVLHLARAGANVVINYGSSGRTIDRSREIERLTKAIAGFGSRSIVVEADTGADVGVAALIKQSTEAFGKIDILVNNAGAPWLRAGFRRGGRRALAQYFDGRGLRARGADRRGAPVHARSALGANH